MRSSSEWYFALKVKYSCCIFEVYKIRWLQYNLLQIGSHDSWPGVIEKQFSVQRKKKKKKKLSANIFPCEKYPVPPVPAEVKTTTKKMDLYVGTCIKKRNLMQKK